MYTKIPMTQRLWVFFLVITTCTITHLSNNLDLICIQEHWFRPGNCDAFKDGFDNFDKFVYSGMSACDLHASGRPYGGIAILARHGKISNVLDLGTSINLRAQCISFECSKLPFLLFNVYFPCVGSVNYAAEVEIICAYMSNIVHNIAAQGTTVLLAGDFNVDLSTVSNIDSLACLDSFITDWNLSSCFRFYTGGVKHTFRCETRGVYSMLDNILVQLSDRCNIRVSSVNIGDDVTNFSDHLPVLCTLHLNAVVNNTVTNGDNSNAYYYAYLWSDVTKQDYYHATGHLLQLLIDSMLLHEAFVTPDVFVNVLFDGIVNTLSHCSASFYKKFLLKPNSPLLWSPALTQLKAASRSALNVWRSMGCPTNGSEKDEMIASRRNYKKAIKCAKRDNKRLVADRMDKLWKGRDSKRFWGLVNKRIKPLSVNSSVLCANNFVDSFKCNFVNSGNNVKAVGSFLLAREEAAGSTIEFTVDELEASVCKLSGSSALDCDKLNSSHLKFAHPSVYVALKMLFNKMLESSCVPINFGRSIITPVVKNASLSLCDVSNYRPVSIISVIAKTFELLISSQFGASFNSHVNQFGFVKDGGCNKAIFALTSVVDYFRDRHSNVFVAALDATKAFDRVNHFSLMSCLLERGLSVKLVNVLYYWYRTMKACVSWNGNRSDFFVVQSGVPQGSVLGPTFFNLIIDKLLERVESSKLGCYVSNKFAGAFAYADDIVLMSASAKQLQLMLNICYEYGIECDLSFNTTKSVCGFVGRLAGNIMPVFHIGHNEVSIVDSFVYLGVKFTFGVRLIADYSARCRKFLASVSSVLRHKVNGFENAFVNILKVKCLPVLYYGLDCINLGTTSLSVVSKSWNTAFRWLFNMKKYDSTRLLFLECQTMSMKFLLNMRFLCFIQSIACGGNRLLKALAYHARCKESVCTLFHRYDLNIYSDISNVRSVVNAAFIDYCSQKLD
jgi:exonuclease III